MEPIISPWAIYVIELLDPLNGFLIIAVVLSAITCIFMFSVYNSEEASEEMQSFQLSCRKNLWKSVTAFIIFTVLCIAVPSKDTAYKMLACYYLTTDNIKTVGNTANDAIDTILDNVVKHINEVKK